MPEYDAFGNPVGGTPPSVPVSSSVSDSISHEREAGPTSAPEPAEAPHQPGPPSPYRPPRPRGGSFARATTGLIVMLAVFGGIALGIYSCVDTATDVADVVKDVRKGITVFSEQSETTVTRVDESASPPKGLSRRSLLRPAAFGKALREIRAAAGGGSPTLLRVDAARIDAQVLLPKGGIRQIARTWNEPAVVVSTTKTGTGQTMRWSEIDPLAPSRLARAVSGGSTRPSRQLNYAVAMGGLRQWSAFTVGGAFYRAELSGRDAQRMSG